MQSKWIKHMVFIPGDRDWLSSNKYGLNNANIIEKILESLPFQNITWGPGHGCPGPKEVEIGDNLLLLIINTQYWNHPFRVPAPVEAECKISSIGEFLEELEDNISESRNKNVLIAGHFPVISTGEYGGAMNFRKHLFPLTDVSPNLWFPLPVVGSLYPAYRQNIGSNMDIINERYQDFNEGIKHILQDRPGLIYVSGHDYIQQLLYSNETYFINSGAFIKYSYSGRSADMIYSCRQQSLFRLEYENTGDVIITSFFVGDAKLLLIAESSLGCSPSHIKCQHLVVPGPTSPICRAERTTRWTRFHQPHRKSGCSLGSAGAGGRQHDVQRGYDSQLL